MREGNWLRKSRVNVSLSAMGQRCLQDLAGDRGVSVSDVIELLCREEHDRKFGRENRPKLRPVIKDV